METKILLENGTNELEVLEFKIDEHCYGINVAKIKEIITYQNVTPVPNAHPSIEGIFMPRDTMITAIDLRNCLQRGTSKPGGLFIVTNFNKLDIAFHAIYEKARAIARMQHFYKSYVAYTSMKKPVEALNSLMKGVSLYPEILKEAQATGDNVVENEVNKAYDNIKSALMQTYGISPDQSEEILALQDDTEYTIRLQEIAGVR